MTSNNGRHPDLPLAALDQVLFIRRLNKADRWCLDGRMGPAYCSTKAPLDLPPMITCLE